MSKIAVIGGGFSGLYLSSLIGDPLIVFEEHKHIGLPEHCTGLISYSTFKSLKLPLNLIEGKYYVMRVYFNDFMRNEVEIHVSEPILRVNRVGVEEYLYYRAIDKGARVVLGQRVRKLNPKKLTVDDKRYDLVVLSEGIIRYFSRRLGLIGKVKPVYSLQLRLKGEFYDKDNVLEVYVTSLTPDFFSWIVPLGDIGDIIIGVATTEKNSLNKRLRLFKNILEKKGKVKIYKELKYFGGVISVGPLGKLGYGKILGIGDAVGLNKPLSGGGIYPITYAGKVLSKIILGYINGAISNPLREYLQALKPLILELKYSHKLASAIRYRYYMLPKTISRLLSFMKVKLVIRNFEYDRHSSLITHVFSKLGFART